jgi:endonuclease YncB( thermonuclease family)
MKTLNLLVFLLIFNTFIMLGFIASQFTGKVVLERITVNLTRAVDGDTIDASDIGRVRLLGINTPEKKQPYYQEAKDYLKSYEGNLVQLELHGKDKYQRTLAYLFYENKLINAEILKQGLANLYVYEKDDYYPKLEKAEQAAREQGTGLWKKSDNFGCIDLVKLKYQEDGKRCTNRELLVLENKCITLSVIIKDSANHIEQVKIPQGIFTKNYSCVWNDDGDTLTVRDETGLLLYYSY